MPAIEFLNRKLSLLTAIVFILATSLAGCASPASILGKKSTAMALSDAKVALTKAEEMKAATYAPLEADKAKEALARAEAVWNKWIAVSSSTDSTGDPKRDERIKEDAIYAMLYARIAQAKSKQARVIKQIDKTEKSRQKHETLKNKLQLEQAQTEAVIARQQKLEAERQTAEMRALQESKAKQEAELRALKETKAKQEAELRALKETKAKEEAQKRALEETKAKEKAMQETLAKEEARKKALQEKILAEQAREKAQKKTLEETKAKEAALKGKQEADDARDIALLEAKTAKQNLQNMENKLSMLSSEFAKVKEEKRGLVVTLSDILFDVDKASLQEGAVKNLDYLANILKDYKDRKILIEGHTDSSGAEEHNQALSEERAFAVMGYLMSHGLDAKMMEAKGFGESKPVTTNDTTIGRQQNRRVDIVILNPETTS